MVKDHNTELRDYLNTLYGTTNRDINPLLMRYLNAGTIVDKTVEMRELKVAAAIENR